MVMATPRAVTVLGTILALAPHTHPTPIVSPLYTLNTPTIAPNTTHIFNTLHSVINSDLVESGQSSHTRTSDSAERTIVPLCPKCVSKLLLPLLLNSSIPQINPPQEHAPRVTTPLPRTSPLLTMEQQRQAQLEVIKAHILSKMQLTEIPHVNISQEQLPSIIRQGQLPTLAPPTTPPSPPPTRSFIVIAKKSTACGDEHDSICLRFSVEGWTWRDGSTAILWIRHQQLDNTTTHQVHVLVTSRGRHSHHGHPMTLPLTPGVNGWGQVDMSQMVSRWWRSGRKHLNIVVRCSTCGSQSHQFSHLPQHRPFMVLTGQEPQIRTRRSVPRECSTETSGRCCRESINITVSDMGWQNWFIQPQSFTFYYCRGSCNPGFNSAQNQPNYTRTKQALMLLASQLSIRQDLTPCCSPIEYSPMSVIYHNSMNVQVHARIQDLQVQSCGCKD